MPNIIKPLGGLTTSAQLAAALGSDKTGTGLAVFNISPAIDTSLTSPSTSFTLLATPTTVNAFAGASVALNIGNASAAAAFPGGISIPTGKTLSGAGSISISGALSIVGASTFTTGTFSGTTNDGTQIMGITQLGTGYVLNVYRTVVSATRPTVKISQLSATGGSQAALHIQQADTGEIALGINTDGSLTVFNFKVLDTGALTTNGGLQTFGANDSAGAGYRTVRVPNI